MGLRKRVGLRRDKNNGNQVDGMNKNEWIMRRYIGFVYLFFGTHFDKLRSFRVLYVDAITENGKVIVSIMAY